MKVIFKGVVEKARKGCPVCGGRSTGNSFRTSKTYILPSGITKMFRVGNVYDLKDMDAEFLLQYRYTDRTGKEVQVFEVYNG